MIRCNQFGQHTRLGNWLFVYAAIVSLAEATGHEVEMPEGYFLWKYLAHPPRLTSDKSYDLLYQAPGPGYSAAAKDEMYRIFRQNRDKVINFDLTCFLQSEKWFDANIVKEKLQFRLDSVCSIFDKYPELTSSQLIGIGIRRGDFVGHDVFYQIPEDWYLNTLNRRFPSWKKNAKVVVFSDDIGWCRNYYAGQPFFYPDQNLTHLHGYTYHSDPMEQFILGANCDYFIGGSSTFTWWQMWMVKNVMDGEVFHCGKNIADQYLAQYGNDDYYPEDWKLEKI